MHWLLLMFCLIAFRFLQAVFKMIVRKRRLKPNHEHISDDDGSISGICIPWIPVSFSIGLSTVAAVLAKGMPLAFVSQMAFTGLDSYTYLAIPMFILAGYLMETGCPKGW